MIIDILNFMVAVATVFLAYRFFIERSKGKKIAEMKVLIYSLISVSYTHLTLPTTSRV